MKYTTTLILTACSASSLSAAVIASYDLGLAGANTFNATTTETGVSNSALSNGSLSTFITNEDLGYPVGSNPVIQAAPTGTTNINAALAVANDSYFSFTVTPDAGQTVDLSNLTFNAARGGSSGTARGYAVRSSVDGFAADLGTADLATVRPTWTSVDIDLSAADFDALTTATTFRIYVYSNSPARSVEFDDIVLNGDISAIPEPSGLALLLLGAASFSARRRR